MSKQNLLSWMALAFLLVLCTGPATAHQTPTSDLLLPYFEVDLSGAGVTTFLSIVNTSGDPVRVKVELRTNWGIEALRSEFTLAGDAVQVINLAGVVLAGQLPERTLDAEEIEHLQAALSGQVSPKNGLYYSSEALFQHAIGSIEVSTVGNPRPDVLIGDFFVVDPLDNFAQGEVLLDIDRAAECPGLCRRHALRFLAGGGFDSGTELVIWNRREIEPSSNPFFPAGRTMSTDAVFVRQNGHRFDQRGLELMPLEIVKISELGLDSPFGWLDILTEDDTIMTVRYSADSRYSVGLQTFCLPILDEGGGEDPPSGNARVDIEKATNGDDADLPDGPEIFIGDPVTWTYEVTNTGDVTLVDILVVDDQGVEVTCPGTRLEPGEAMTCTGEGTATAGSYANLGTVTAVSSDGGVVRDDDPSHYFGKDRVVSAFIELEKATNGHDADTAPGPEILEGETVIWSYNVKNPNPELTLVGIALVDDREGTIGCPKTTLVPNETMVCTHSGVAGPGAYRNLATVTAHPEGFPGVDVSDSDPSHYRGRPLPVSIDLEKATNGHDADAAPGPAIEEGAAVTWTFVVTNTGQARLTQIAVTDDREGAVSCPRSTLEPGAAMTCTHSGVAQLGNYANLGTVSARGPKDESVKATDPSHYHGTQKPAPSIRIEKATNGHDADTAPGPTVETGSTVTWTYAVTNTGNVRLSSVAVTDNREGAVSCPRSTLEPGSSMTCTATGSARTGQYANLGTVTGTSPQGTPVSDDDPSHYYGKEPPSYLTLVKHVINDDGGTARVSDFALFVDGQRVTSGVAVQLAAGTYRASEQNLDGYTAGPWGGDCAADGSVTLQPGDNKVCEIVNDDVRVCDPAPSFEISSGRVEYNDPHRHSHHVEVSYDFRVGGELRGEVQIFWKNGSSTFVKKRKTIERDCEDPASTGHIEWDSDAKSHHPDHGARYFARLVVGGQVISSVPLN